MTILAGDIHLLQTQVMLDVPEGGGAATAIVVPDGTSNAVFPDVSEVDRSLGRVNLRKLVVHVDTAGVDDYLGPNVIVAEPPNDPNISITLFSTGDAFDRRTDAVSRIEAYLSVGPQYFAYLYGNHITGQDSLLMFQKTGDLPPIGDTLVLTKREGYSDQFVQYVRVIEASAVQRQFEDSQGTYTRWILTLRLASTLTADFPGFDIQRIDYTKAQIALLTKLSDTVVANAARYYGVTPLEVAGSIGDYSIKGVSMFTQLVPSAQVETPIADARTNQVTSAVIPAGGAISRSLTAVFNTTQNLFIGGAIAPNTLSVTQGSVTVTDSGGRLMTSGSQVGTVDYANGVLALTVAVFGTAGVTMTVAYALGAVPASVTQSQGIDITAETRSLSYVRTIQPPPVPGTLSISYMAQGRWYVLSDAGDGGVRGADSAYGAGSLNPTSGTISVTLGALPDVGSSVIYQWVSPDAARASDALVLDNNGKLYWPFNSSGVSASTPGTKPIVPGRLSLAWNDGVARTATDNGSGAITGDATGSVSYALGTFAMIPNLLPAPGTTINVNFDSSTAIVTAVALSNGGGNIGSNSIKPGSVSFPLRGQLYAQYLTNAAVLYGDAANFMVRDDGAGALVLTLTGRQFDTVWTPAQVQYYNNATLPVGTINYSTGAITLTNVVTLARLMMLMVTSFDTVFVNIARPSMNVVVTV